MNSFHVDATTVKVGCMCLEFLLKSWFFDAVFMS
jgi:hypothetical protein